jgi:hypothetical protein
MAATESYALVQRPAKYSWEALTLLLATDQETPDIIVHFPRPVTIVSAYPSIAVAGGLTTLDTPTLDDLLVKIELEVGADKRLTSRFDTTNPGGGIGRFVTLGSYRDTSGGARVMLVDLGQNGSRADISIAFRWKRSVAGGPYYRDIQIGLVLHVNYQGE